MSVDEAAIVTTDKTVVKGVRDVRFERIATAVEEKLCWKANDEH